MKRIWLLVMACLMLAAPASAAALKVYVAEFNVTGVQNRDEVKGAIPVLLASRLAGDKVATVAVAADADVTVSGTYILIGKIFSLDAVAKDSSGKVVARSFIQGEGGAEQLIATVNQLAAKLSPELAKVPVVEQPAATVPVKAAPKNTEIIRNAEVQGGDLQRMPQGDVIRPQAFYRGAPNKGEIKRLDGRFNLLAVGETGKDGKRLLFMAQTQSVQLLREGDNRPITGFSLSGNQRVVSLDYVDADGDGKAELYVTIVDNGEVKSQIRELKDNKLVKVAENIPYFFRAIALAGGPLKLYAQEQGRGAEQFYGDVYEVTRQGKKIIRKAKHVMPRFANIYSFNQIKIESGELLTIAYHEHNYLVVYDKQQNELWRSNDPFGGSELFYQVEDLDNFKALGDKYRWFFMNQRIQVSSKQEVLVGKNDGFWVLGNARMYKKGAVYSLYWNGAALEEVWRTKDTQNYMPDFYFDEPKSELLLLQLTQRDDPLTFTKGASALQIKKVE